MVYIHPFADEMNKARRMAALQARAMAQSGYSVLQIDLHGCGDSTGDFGDAQWNHWVNDVVVASQWLRRHGSVNASATHPPALWLWGLRSGCLVGIAASAYINDACHFVLWQPPPSGRVLLQQFLRIQVAADMLKWQDKGGMERLHHRLKNGVAVEVAGYMLSPALAHGLEQATLDPPACKKSVQRVEWFELSTVEPAVFSCTATAAADRWRHAGYAVRNHVVSGPAFWQTSEIAEIPALLSATTASLQAQSA